MKNYSLLLALMLFIPFGLYGGTDPHWLQIQSAPLADIRAFGAKETIDCTAAFEAAAATGNTVFIPEGTWPMCATISANVSIRGTGPASIITPSVPGAAAITFTGKGSWEYNEVCDVRFSGGDTGNGVAWDGTDDGRTVFDRVSFYECVIGINKVSSIGLDVRSCNFSHNGVGLYSYGDSVSQHAGCVLITNSHFNDNASAAIYIHDDYNASGQFTILNSVFEYNYGHNIAVTGWKGDAQSYIRVTDCWFENWAGQAPVSAYWPFSTDIVLPTITALPADILCHNAGMVVENCRLQIINASGSTMILDKVWLEQGYRNQYSYFTNGGGNNITWRDRRSDGNNIAYQRVSTDGLTESLMTTNVFTEEAASAPLYLDVFRLPHRVQTTLAFQDYLYKSMDCASTTDYLDQFGASFPRDMSDGILFDSCVQLTGNAARPEMIGVESTTPGYDPGGVNTELVGGYYYAWSFDARRISGPETLKIFDASAVPLYGVPVTGLEIGEWTTLGGIFYTPPGIASGAQFYIGTTFSNPVGVYNISAIQCVRFVSFQAAKTYLDSGLYTLSPDGK